MTKIKTLEQYRKRTNQRNIRHPNWRQTFNDCNGMCQFPVSEGVICGEVDGLEFHELYGETKENELRPQLRVLLCQYHHASIEGVTWFLNRKYTSMLQEDIAFEIALCGGLQEWLKAYNLIEREVNFDKAFYSQGHQGYFNDSKNS